MSGQRFSQHSDHGRRLLRVIGVAWILLGVSLLLSWLYNPATVSIEWNTATEIDTAGFYIYRSQTPEGGFSPLNTELIEGRGDAQSGADYTYEDKNVLPGETYYYFLEEIEYDSSTKRYSDEMFSHTVPNRWWAIVSSVASVLIGLALLMSSFKGD